MEIKMVPVYSIDELCTFQEAADAIGVRYDAISEAVRYGALTSTRLPDHPNKKFVLKLEVDALAGGGKVASKKARAIVEMARRKSGHSQDLPSTDTVRSVVTELDARIDRMESVLDQFNHQLEEFAAQWAVAVAPLAHMAQVFAAMASQQGELKSQIAQVKSTSRSQP